MMSSSLSIVGKIDKKLSSALEEVCNTITQLNIRYVIVGATARDMVLHYGYGAKIQRATMDIDFGIQVSSWDTFFDLKERLLSKGFRGHKKIQHRLESPSGIVVDIIPFTLSDREKDIAWPPDKEIVMNVAGFREACESADQVQINPNLWVSVATPPGMALLKIIAWKDRAREKRRKDAQDIAYLLSNYEIIPAVQDFLYTEGAEIMERFEWDITLSSAYLLGRHAKDIAQEETISRVDKIFSGSACKPDVDVLIEEMCSNVDIQYDRNKSLILEFFSGFNNCWNCSPEY